MAGCCFAVVEAIHWLFYGEMVDIGTSDKITNLWPASPSRPVEKSGQKEKSKKDQHHSKKHKDENEITKEGPGKNIDEYV